MDLPNEAQELVIGPDVDQPGTLTEPRQFNLMFKTYVGALEDPSAIAYLRPETAQGIFANFRNVMDTSRVKIPFGIAQIGKAFRNEVTPRNYIFRSREFEQMEIEFFVHPDEAKAWYDFWTKQRFQLVAVDRDFKRQFAPSSPRLKTSLPIMPRKAPAAAISNTVSLYRSGIWGAWKG